MQVTVFILGPDCCEHSEDGCCEPMCQSASASSSPLCFSSTHTQTNVYVTCMFLPEVLVHSLGNGGLLACSK